MAPVTKFRKEKRPQKKMNVSEMLITRDRVPMVMTTFLS